jgi:hypothetical protein
MGIKGFLKVYYFIQVEEFKMCLQAKDEHCSPSELFIMI